MKFIPKIELIRRLNIIYDQIPSFDCRHCQQCSSPIIWLKPEEINIKEYLKKYHLQYLTLSDEEFQKNNLRCPYQQHNRCIIYPVRPLVCRLQGLIPDLPCQYNNTKLLSKEKYRFLIDELNKLNTEIHGEYELFSTRMALNSNFVNCQKPILF